MPTDKTSVGYRFSEQTKATLEEASRVYGLSQTAILEVLVALLGRGHLTIEEDQARPRPRPRRSRDGTSQESP
jgi:hypothetical protein